ncbi:MAG: tetratricopeptide repeat protein [Candidatus Hydrogenedentota bacterium]|nr:MAG: tetratricopeptide repeat protein [Candidatus Hydrogenedentota bacterium]
MKPSSFQAFLESGHKERLRGNFSGAIAFYEKARTAAGSNEERDEALAGKALALRGLQQYPGAVRLLSRLVRNFEARNDIEGVSFIEYSLGTCFRFLGRFRDAERHLNRSLQLASDPESVCFVSMAVGGLLRMTGRYKESLASYRHACHIARRLGQTYPLAYAHCGIGNAYRMLDRRPLARKHLENACHLYRRIRDRVSYPYTLWALALLDLSEKGIDKKHRLGHAERLFRKTKDRRGLVHIHLARAVEARVQGRNPRPSIRHARRTARKLGLRFEILLADFLEMDSPSEKLRKRFQHFGADLPPDHLRIP